MRMYLLKLAETYTFIFVLYLFSLSIDSSSRQSIEKIICINIIISIIIDSSFQQKYQRL